MGLNQNEDGVDCGAPCNSRKPLESCTLLIGAGEAPNCIQDCKIGATPECGGPFPSETIFLKNVDGGKCYYQPKGALENYPGCPPGSKGKQCDTMVYCKSADGWGCSAEAAEDKKCWPSDDPEAI